MRFLRKIRKIITFFIIVFILGNIGLYIYCLLTPKIEITRNQSYYLFDNNLLILMIHIDQIYNLYPQYFYLNILII